MLKLMNESKLINDSDQAFRRLALERARPVEGERANRAVRRRGAGPLEAAVAGGGGLAPVGRRKVTGGGLQAVGPFL